MLHRIFLTVEEIHLKKKKKEAFQLRLSRLRTQLVFMRMCVRSLASLSGLKIQHCGKLLHRWQIPLELVLLWLWRRLAAIALYGWEPLYAAGTALKRKQKERKKRNTALELKTASLCGLRDQPGL